MSIATRSAEAEAPEAPEAPPVPLWHQSAFVRWFAADTLTRTAVSLTSLVVPLVAIAALGSASQAGVVAAATGLGTTLGLLPGGVLADRCHRRRVVLICTSVNGVLHLALAGLIAHGAPSGARGGATLAALFLGIGLCSTLATPAFTATLKVLLDPRQFPTAISATEARQAAVALVCPALGGLLFGLGHAAPFAAAAAAVLAGGLCFWRVREPGPTRNDGSATDVASGAPAGRRLAPFAGLAFVCAHPVLRPLLATGMLVNLVGTALVTTVVFHLHRQGTAPAVIGLLGTATAATALLGALLSAVVVVRLRAGLVVLVGLGWLSASLVPLLFVHHPAAIVAMVAAGVLTAPSINAVVGGYTVTVVPRALQGRADAGVALVSTLALPAAPLVAGFGLDRLGFTATVAGLVALVGLAILPCLLSSGVRRLPSAQGWQSAADPDGAAGEG